MDGFTGFKTATTEELPDAVAVMDPFHVVRLAGDALDECRRRIQHDIRGHRGRKGDPLFASRRTLHTGADLLTDKQRTRLDELLGHFVQLSGAVYDIHGRSEIHGHDIGSPRVRPNSLLAVVSRSTVSADPPGDACRPRRKDETMAQSYNGYCVKCKDKRDFEGEATETNGRRMAKGICQVCGTKMNRLLGKA
jgi:hypothetical protein